MSLSFYTESAPAGRPSLLIADDDPVVRSSLSMALDHRFELVAVAADGKEAVAKAAECHPDAALLDVDMPAGGGQHAVKGIAECSPGTALIILSGDESDGIVVELLQSGAMAYCRKGGDHRHLGVTIERSIRAHRALGDSSHAA